MTNVNGLDSLCQSGTLPQKALHGYGFGDSGRYDKRTPREVAYQLAMAHKLSGGLAEVSSGQVEGMLEIIGFPASETVVVYSMEPETTWHAQALNALRHARRNRIECHDLKEWMRWISDEEFSVRHPYISQELSRMIQEIVEADRKLTQVTDGVLNYGKRDKV